MMKITDEIKKLFRKVKVSLGAPVRSVELTDDMLCELLEMSVEDVMEKIQNWLIQTQWSNIYGKHTTKEEMTMALTTRSFDITKDYSYWFSKQVGLQQEGPWELKKDYVTIEKGKQVYVIPAGRMVNKVMYVNPPTSQAALFANYGGIDIGFGGGYAQLGGGAYGPVGGFYTAPAADVAYLATDINYKNRLLRCDLVYKITAGPNGTHLLHLMSTPGSKLSFGYMGGNAGSIGLVGSEVWYTYYDASPEQEEDCINDHAGEIVITPDQVPLGSVSFDMLNEPTKVTVRQILVAKAKQTLGLVRGKYSGKVSIPQAEMSMDYTMLIQQGKDEYDAAINALKERLDKMSPENMLEAQAKIVQNTLEVQKGTPLGLYVI